MFKKNRLVSFQKISRMAVSVEEINEFKACIGPKGVEIANKEILQATIE